MGKMKFLLIFASCMLMQAYAQTCALSETPCPVPKWPVEWNLTRSTMCQPGSTQGYFLPPASEPWGLVSLDWSIAEGIWFRGKNRSNTTCEATLIENCRLLKVSNTATRCFIYHNMELALQWLESQREVMYDPTKADYFLQYLKNGVRNGTIYNEPIEQGDQFFWNFTNPEASQYFVKSISKVLDNPYVDGTFTDDVDGLPNEHTSAPARIGMSSSEVDLLRKATQHTNQQLIDALVEQGKYVYQALGNQDGVFGQPTKGNCLSWMRKNCNQSRSDGPLALQMDGDQAAKNQTLAAFLIVRPRFGWLGWGWESDQKQWLPDFLKPFGVPQGYCEETRSGVFARKWSSGVVQLNCSDWTAKLSTI